MPRVGHSLCSNFMLEPKWTESPLWWGGGECMSTQGHHLWRNWLYSLRVWLQRVPHTWVAQGLLLQQRWASSQPEDQLLVPIVACVLCFQNISRDEAANQNTLVSYAASPWRNEETSLGESNAVTCTEWGFLLSARMSRSSALLRK